MKVWIVIKKVYATKWSWPNFRYNPNICMEEVRKPIKISIAIAGRRSPGRDLSPRRLEHEAGVLATVSRLLIMRKCCSRRCVQLCHDITNKNFQTPLMKALSCTGLPTSFSIQGLATQRSIFSLGPQCPDRENTWNRPPTVYTYSCVQAPSYEGKFC
jgi:hypothetical protein